MQPTREFPVDPANPAGFDNSGESLTMSPALLKKYLQAARDVADHMVLTPDGIHFAPYPMLRGNRSGEICDRADSSIFTRGSRPISPTTLRRHGVRTSRGTGKAGRDPRRHRGGSESQREVSADGVAASRRERTPMGPIAKLQEMWRGLPATGVTSERACEMRRDARFRGQDPQDTAMQFAAPVVKGLPAGVAAVDELEIARVRGTSPRLRSQDLRNDTESAASVPVIPIIRAASGGRVPLGGAFHERRAADADLVVPAAERARYEAAFSRFAVGFPGRVLRQGARPIFSGRFRGQGPPSERRLSQHDGLFPRRYSADAVDPR